MSPTRRSFPLAWYALLLAVVFIAGDTNLQTLPAGQQPAELKSKAGEYAAPEDLTQARNREQSPHAARIEAALLEQTEVAFVGQTIAEAIQFLAELHDLPIRFDKAALQEGGIPTDTVIDDLVISGITLESALNLIFEEVEFQAGALEELTWIVEDEVMKITTKFGAEERIETHVYDVSGLLRARYSGTELAQLVEVMTERESWESAGGLGVVMEIDDGLVVSNSQPVHREVAALLDQLLRLSRSTGPSR